MLTVVKVVHHISGVSLEEDFVFAGADVRDGKEEDLIKFKFWCKQWMH